MWNIKTINFICRIVQDDNDKFKFDLLLRNEVLITDGKVYDSFVEASSALHTYLDSMYAFETDKINFSKEGAHLVVNETI